jgi:hypothetical protein
MRSAPAHVRMTGAGKLGAMAMTAIEELETVLLFLQSTRPSGRPPSPLRPPVTAGSRRMCQTPLPGDEWRH